jgi:hypothetical protein
MLSANTIQNSSPELREFLELSCIYLAASDEQFSGAEQAWIDTTFGHGTADRFLADLANIQWGHVFTRIEELAGQIPAQEIQLVSAGVEDFFKQLLSVDGLDPREEECLSEFLEHLLDAGINVGQATPQQEVEKFEARLKSLLSMHIQQGGKWDWVKLATLLPPPYPSRFNTNRLRALQTQLVWTAASINVPQDFITAAEREDETTFQTTCQGYYNWHGDFQDTRQVAYRVTRGEIDAYYEVLQRMGPFASIEKLGSTVDFIFHNNKIAECTIAVHGMNVIPTKEKTLTKRGKLSIKKMTRARFHELYQDYVCGCILRVAREMFALLPLEYVLVIAKADIGDPPAEHPVMSVIFPSKIMDEVDFESIDPSNCVENYVHRGDFKASRQSEAFRAIVPLTVVDIPETEPEQLSFEQLKKEVERMREEVSERCNQWRMTS